jgi:hypothetical protein
LLLANCWPYPSVGEANFEIRFTLSGCVGSQVVTILNE